MWKGHGEMKISPWKKKKKLLPIFSEWKDAHISKFPTIKENTKTHVEQKSRLRVLVYASYLRCFNCTHVSNVLSLPLTEREQLDREKRENKSIRKFINKINKCQLNIVKAVLFMLKLLKVFSVFLKYTVHLENIKIFLCERISLKLYIYIYTYIQTER